MISAFVLDSELTSCDFQTMATHILDSLYILELILAAITYKIASAIWKHFILPESEVGNFKANCIQCNVVVNIYATEL